MTTRPTKFTALEAIESIKAPIAYITGDTINVATQKTPASASAPGTAGDICMDAGYVYVCVAANTWKRAAIATW